MTTVSSASGGARTSRQLNISRPWREALPQRLRGSRRATAAGLTPSAAAWSAIVASIANRACSRNHASRTRSARSRSRASSATRSSGPADVDDPGDGRAPAGRRGTSRAADGARRGTGSTAPSASPPRAASSARCARLSIEMAADPRLALAQELVDQPLRMGPAAAGRERDGDDEAVLGIDRDPEPARAGGSAEDVGRWRHRRRWCHTAGAGLGLGDDPDRDAEPGPPLERRHERRLADRAVAREHLAPTPR